MRSFIKKTLAVLLSAMLLLSAVPITAMAAETTAQECVGASSGTTGDCTWTLDDDGLLTISGNGAMADYGFCGPWGDKISVFRLYKPCERDDRRLRHEHRQFCV